MHSQKELWRVEHSTAKIFRAPIHLERPSTPIPDFAKFLEGQRLAPKKSRVLDIGCGNGRNSIYLASLGFTVVGVDFFPESSAEASATSQHLPLVFESFDLKHLWPYDAETFEAIIDCHTTFCIPNPGRERAVEQAYRTLRPGGYYLFYGIKPTDLHERFPGPEPGSTILPKNGMFEKHYLRDELLETYGDFTPVKLQSVSGKRRVDGEFFDCNRWIAIFQKP